MTTATNRSEHPQAAEDFRRAATFTSPPEAVLDALTTTAGIAGWWGDTVGSAGRGGTFEVGFGSDRSIDIAVTAADTGRVEWKVRRAPHTPEWDGTTIVFSLEPAARGTALEFLHHGLTPQLECFDMCNEGWTHYLGSLVDYVDHDAGRPYRHGRGSERDGGS
jgi:uncharacterized protein YndB with AHSA1/START domain